MSAPNQSLRGFSVATKKTDAVNLDALIRRQDLEIVDQAANASTAPRDIPIPVSELATDKLHYRLLRKPSFQRETDDWSIDHVVTLLKSFRDGHLIPAVILWRGDTGYTFVIDGAHRLSALIAWVNNDYGAGLISSQFFREIPKRQKMIADECKKEVASQVGTYQDLSSAIGLPNPTQEQLRFAANLASPIVSQTVSGDSKAARVSFLAINQRAVEIHPTERYMIEHMDKPNVIAARALVRSARGHQYWNKFDPTIRASIEKRAKAIYNAIYEPEDAEPSSAIDLQPAGQAYTANGLRIAIDLVNLTNGVKNTVDADDTDGKTTEKFIERTWGVVKYIGGQEAACLNLHPAVYFWAHTGNHQPTTFLAVAAFVQDMVSNNELIEFTKVRAKFEEFLVTNAAIRTNILGRYGGWKKSLGPVKGMLRTLFNGLKSGKTDDDIEREILKHPDGSDEPDLVAVGSPNWRETKSALRRQASLDSAIRCPICKARMVNLLASDDHIKKRSDGGPSTPENAQLTHHYCNSGFKEHFTQKGLPLPEISSPV
jgi:hypothetical protein